MISAVPVKFWSSPELAHEEEADFVLCVGMEVYVTVAALAFFKGNGENHDIWQN